ncbi:MAG: DUF4115 domain-containing protein [Candidatus Aminicenantes bacterium]|nr:DUF4115 domain-containing protein [Candidatus Aminicenantes bacterium]
MSTLGQELNREREARGIPLQEIARQTKINIQYLLALEQDRLDLLPGEFFIKGTIRAYAKCIGLDENQAINIYLRQAPRPSPAKIRPRRETSPRMSAARWKKLALLLLPPLILAAVLVFFRPWLLNIRPAPANSSPPAAETAAKSEARAPAGPAEAQERPEAGDADGLVFHLTFNDEVWIRIRPDSGPAEEGLMQAGDRKSFSAEERIVMRLGRPDQVNMTINGLKAKPFPASAAAQTYEINKDNYRNYLAE